MLFYMLQRYPNIKNAVINDINSDLITCYRTIRDTPEQLIDALKVIENAFLTLEKEEDRKSMFLTVRNRYNEKNLNPIENTTLFLFLNRTCFNGLYRVNKKGYLMYLLESTKIQKFVIQKQLEKIVNCRNVWKF